MKRNIDTIALKHIRGGEYERAVAVIASNEDLEDADAWNLVAAFLYQGEGVDKREQDAIDIWTRLADSGDARSSFVLGSVLVRQSDDQSVLCGLERLKRATSLGSDEAMGVLAQIYYAGIGPIPADSALCIDYLRQAADIGNTEAMLTLASYYKDGDLVPQSYEESLRLNQLAAENGHPGGHYNLALAYERGEGVPINESEAFRHYHLAATQGVPEAQHNLGACYFNGKGTAQDKAKAIHCYLEAAVNDSPMSQHCLGLCFHHGDGVEKQDVTALSFFLMAVENGSEESKPYASALIDSMDQAEIDSAANLKNHFKTRYQEYWENQPDETRH